MEKLDLSKIVSVRFPVNQYMKEETAKKQIVLHHTVSPDGIGGDVAWWESTPERVATCMLVTANGTPHQLFSSRYWAHHLGIKTTTFEKYDIPKSGSQNTILNKASIGIEIDSMGGLVKHKGYWFAAGAWKDGAFLPNTKHQFKPEQIQEYPNGFRGFKAFAKYTPAQIKTTGELILLWAAMYDIPSKYNEDMWRINKKALLGEPGIWAHVSYREDKSDVHPQPELIEMLQQVEKICKSL